MKRFLDPAVARVFNAYPPEIRRDLLTLREQIFRTAASTQGVGELVETLKWGVPAYLTLATGSGSTIRIGWAADHPDRYAMYFHCRTNLVRTFRSLFGSSLAFERNRAIVFRQGQPLPLQAVRFCIADALTYHLKPRLGITAQGPRFALPAHAGSLR